MNVAITANVTLDEKAFNRLVRKSQSEGKHVNELIGEILEIYANRLTKNKDKGGN